MGKLEEVHGHLQDRCHVLPPAIKVRQQTPQAFTAQGDPSPASRQAKRLSLHEKGKEPPEPITEQPPRPPERQSQPTSSLSLWGCDTQ